MALGTLIFNYIYWGFGFPRMGTTGLVAGARGAGDMLINVLTDLPEVRETARLYLPWAAALPVLAVASYQLDGIIIDATRTAEMRNAMIIVLGGFVVLGSWFSGAMGNHGLGWPTRFSWLRGPRRWRPITDASSAARERRQNSAESITMGSACAALAHSSIAG